MPRSDVDADGQGLKLILITRLATSLGFIFSQFLTTDIDHTSTTYGTLTITCESPFEKNDYIIYLLCPLIAQ